MTRLWAWLLPSAVLTFAAGYAIGAAFHRVGVLFELVSR